MSLAEGGAANTPGRRTASSITDRWAHNMSADAAAVPFRSPVPSGSGKSPQKSVLKPLIARLQSERADVRQDAAEELGVLAKDKDNKTAILRAGAIDPLVKLLRGGEVSVQETAAWALGHLAENSADIQAEITLAGGREALEALARDGSVRVQKDAAWALQHIAPPAAAAAAATPPPLAAAPAATRGDKKTFVQHSVEIEIEASAAASRVREAAASAAIAAIAATPAASPQHGETGEARRQLAEEQRAREAAEVARDAAQKGAEELRRQVEGLSTECVGLQKEKDSLEKKLADFELETAAAQQAAAAAQQAAEQDRDTARQAQQAAEQERDSARQGLHLAEAAATQLSAQVAHAAAAQAAAEERMVELQHEREAIQAAAEARVAQLEHELDALRAANGAGGAPSPSPRGLVSFTPAELEAGTLGFAEDAMLGTGGFGSVYRATELPSLAASAHGFAVKRLAADSLQGDAELRSEVALLGRYQHEALLPLLGFCLDPQTRCLVYPLMPSGNLEDRLMPTAGDAPRRLRQLGLPARPLPLTWQQRLRAIRDVARALCYLHTPMIDDGKPVLLHRDLKPANVLLDAQVNAKLADVGLARAAPALGPGGATHLMTQSLVGSPGFIDPLYTETGRFSEITDGYALGISLLMCLTGRSAVGLLDHCADALENPTAEAIATILSSDAGAWPTGVAAAMTRVVIGLSWQRVRSRRMGVEEALRLLEAAADEGGVRAGVAVASAERECVICMSVPRAARFGCGHCCCCENCAAILQARSNGCPVCRVPIRAVTERGGALADAPTFVQPR